MRSDLDDDQRSQAEGISSSSMDLFTQFNRMLNFAKYNTGAIEFQEMKFSLGSLLNKGLSAQEERALAKGLVFELDVPEMIGDVFGDGDRLLNMLQGLVDDSLEATSKGTVTVSVSYVYSSLQDVVVRFEVMDRGESVFSMERGNLFGALVTLDHPKRTRAREMGLSVCQKVAAAMGGSMGTHPRPGGGVIVWFEVRLRREVQNSSSVEKSVGKGTSKETLAQKTVLVVDDNPISRKVVVKHLLAMGVHVEVTGSGHAAIELMKTQPYDLVILDMAVYDVDSEEMISCLRGGGSEAPPLLGIVAQSDGGASERCLELGVSAIIRKPLEARLLKETVVDVLGH